MLSLDLAHLPDSAEALRTEIRKLITDETAGLSVAERSRSWMGYSAEFSKALAKAGFLGLTLPKEYGGHGLGPFARFVVVEELLCAGAPVAAHWIADRQSAPLILNYGTEQQRQKYIPAICRGEIFFSIGMSEPGAGSDLSAVKTRAVRQADGSWRLSGNKIWTTNAHLNHYMIALVRTSGDADSRHAGLSQFIIDLTLPGVTIRPIPDVNGEQDFCEIFFDEVILHADCLIGEEGVGWAQVGAELAFERSGPERIYSSIILLDAWIRHIGQVGGNDSRRTALVGNLTAQMSALRQVSIAVTARLEAGESPAIEASLIKDMGNSFEQLVPQIIADDLGSHPDQPVDGELLHTLKLMSQIAPSFSLRGGTREILRGIIARGLGLR
jgi:alkylation response protein AidB-like acyl-CoA dehydrogenase